MRNTIINDIYKYNFPYCIQEVYLKDMQDENGRSNKQEKY